MNTVLLWLGRNHHPSLSAFIQQAVAAAFPFAAAIKLGQLAEARQHPRAAQSLLLLAEPESKDVTQVLVPVDVSGTVTLPIVAFSSTLDPMAGLEIVRPASSLQWATQSLLNAAALRDLRQENARLRGDMLSIGTRISHDLRTPLGGIKVTADLLKEVLTEEKPDLVNLVKPIEDSTDEMFQWIAQISLLTKATGQSIPPAAMNMGSAVLAACERLEGQILQRKIFLIQPANWPEVTGVSSWLEAIWWHLLSNALQHNGSFTRVEMGWDRVGENYRFWAQNAGAGMSAEKRMKLFQPFHQLHETNARKGLGLSIVQRLVELHGGTCDYEAGLGDNHRFIFTLPLRPCSACATPAQ